MRHDCDCPDDRLCDRCYGSALMAARRQAEVVGQCWAESVCRGEHRARETWPDDGKARSIAARKVATLTSDPRMVAELAEFCMRGAAAWWAHRPARYRL